MLCAVAYFATVLAVLAATQSTHPIALHCTNGEYGRDTTGLDCSTTSSDDFSVLQVALTVDSNRRHDVVESASPLTKPLSGSLVRMPGIAKTNVSVDHNAGDSHRLEMVETAHLLPRTPLGSFVHMSGTAKTNVSVNHHAGGSHRVGMIKRGPSISRTQLRSFMHTSGTGKANVSVDHSARGSNRWEFAFASLGEIQKKFNAGVRTVSQQSRTSALLYLTIGLMCALIIFCVCFELQTTRVTDRGRQDPKGGFDPESGSSKPSLTPASNLKGIPTKPNLASAQQNAASSSPVRLFGQNSLLRPLSPMPSPRTSQRQLASNQCQPDGTPVLNPRSGPNIDATYWVPLDRLPEDPSIEGSFPILRSAVLGSASMSQEPVFYCRVRTSPSGARRLAIAKSDQGTPLASCESWLTTSGTTGNFLKIHDFQGNIWGKMQFADSDVYYVYRGEEHIMTLQGDANARTFRVFFGNDTFAHAQHSAEQPLLKIGVKPHIDPILVLVCVLAVGLIGPEAI